MRFVGLYCVIILQYTVQETQNTFHSSPTEENYGYIIICTHLKIRKLQWTDLLSQQYNLYLAQLPSVSEARRTSSAREKGEG